MRNIHNTMRETKEQTITRLKQKVANLEAELKELKSSARAQAKELKNKLAETKSQNKSVVKEQSEQYNESYNTLNRKYKVLRDKFYAMMLKNSRSKQNALFSMDLAIGMDDEWHKQIENDNKERLEAYQRGDILDPFGNLFFFNDSLILTINPNTGERLSQHHLALIFQKLKDKGEYIMALSEVRACKRKGDGLEYLMLVDRKGRELFNLFYSDFDFSV